MSQFFAFASSFKRYQRRVFQIISTCLPALLVFLTLSSFSKAHEYWIEPERFHLPKNEIIYGHLKNGENFSGSIYSYLTSNFEHFTYSIANKKSPLKGREGDIPALKLKAENEGLYIFAYQSRPDRLQFSDWQKFTRDYLEYEGLGKIAEAHLERGLPKTGFKESYQRCAKALVGVGHARGSDHQIGLEYELVAEANPYNEKIGKKINALPFRLYWRGKPATNAPVNVFRKHHGKISNHQVSSDENGRFVLAYEPGTYLLNAVHIEPIGSVDRLDQPVWQSWWASIVFSLNPEKLAKIQ